MPRRKPRPNLWGKVATHLDPKQLAALILALAGIVTSQQQGARLASRSGNAEAQMVAMSGAVVRLEARVDSLTLELHRLRRHHEPMAQADTVIIARRSVARGMWSALTLPWRMVTRGGNG